MRFLMRVKTKDSSQRCKSLIPTLSFIHLPKVSNKLLLIISSQNLQFSLVSKISFLESLPFGALVDTSIPTSLTI